MATTAALNAASEAAPKRVVIIGAGWAGLVAAKTYLEISPDIKLTIFEAERKLGGVWNEDRCFPGFLADSPTGLFDFSDIPMRDVIGQKDWSDLSGYKVYEYLKTYAENFSLLERIRPGTKVSHVSRNIDGQAWDVEIEGSGEVITCDKLIVASGLNSKPVWPKISTEGFEGMAIHSKDIGLHHQELISEKVNRVTVYGGGKSAVDAITLCIMANKRVDWVIRETGNGPGVLGPIKIRGVHGGRFAGRFKDILTPSIFSINTFWYRFLHSGRSRIGNWIFRKAWAKASSTPFTLEPYKTRSPNIEKLMPETQNLLFFTAGISALNYGIDKFIEELHSGNLIQVHRAAIMLMAGSTVKLSNGESFPSDAAIFATGWDFRSTIFDSATALEVGTTAMLKDENPEIAAYWAKLRAEAEKEVFETLPVLKNPPPFHEREVDYTPFRLYRHILPPSLAAKNDRSLVFLGLVTSVQTTIYAEVSALWGISWMEGLLDVQKSKGEMDYEIAKVNSWCERRYLARGATRQIASAEIQQVTDMLMKDMGLKIYRKGNWFSETFVPIRSQDYKGIVQEMLSNSSAKNRRTEEAALN